MYKNIQSFMGKTQPPGSLLAAVQCFLRERQPEVAPASLIHLYRSLRQHGQRLDNPLLSAITPRLLSAYVDDLLTEYSPGTVRPIVGDLKQFYRWCHLTGLSDADNGRFLKKPRRVKEKHHAEESDMLSLIRFLASRLNGLLYQDIFGNVQAVNDGWQYDDYKTLHDLTAVSFLYESGCRAGELCNISAHRLVQVISKPSSTYPITCYGKTHDRNYRVTNTTAALCRLWLGKRPFSATWVFVSWRRGHQPGKLSTGALSQMIARRCRQADITEFRAHAIRHSKVIRSRKIAGLEIANRLIDHSSLSTTREYDYIDDQELDNAATLTGLPRDLW